MSGFTENYVKVKAPYQKDLVNTVQEIVIDEKNNFAQLLS